jgi:hypothetical protein
VEQELPTLPEHPTSSPGLSAVRVARSLVFCVVFWISDEIGKDREVITTNRTYPWEFVTQMTMTFCSVHD